MRSLRLCLAASLALVGCEPGPTEAPVAEEEVAARTPVLTEVHLATATAKTDFRWGTELRGLTTIAVELGLADLPGVVPILDGAPPPPAVAQGRPIPRRSFDASLTLGGTDEATTFTLRICPRGVPDPSCTTTLATGSRLAPWAAYGELLEGAARALDAEVDDATRAAWRRPGSSDTYAELLTGRSCATWLGLLPRPAPPVSVEVAAAEPPVAPPVGDRRSDPIARAVYLDPAQPLAQWVLARALLVPGGDRGAAEDALKRAILSRPGAPLLLADLATVQRLSGSPGEAVEAWQTLVERAPTDPRWLEPYAEALYEVGRLEDARAVLDAVPADFAWDPTYARLRVVVTEALAAACLERPGATAAGCAVDLDPLLEHWQRADPRAVEPVQRRMAARVARRDYEAAITLLPVMRVRAPGPETDALEVALQTAAGHLEAAARAAPPDVAVRLWARLAREQDPAAAIAGLPEGDRAARLADGDAALWRNQPSAALGEAEAALGGNPYDADALVLRARALDAAGRGSDAVEAWRRAWRADPAADGGPVSARRIASAWGAEVEAEPAVPSVVAPVTGPPGHLGPGM